MDIHQIYEPRPLSHDYYYSNNSFCCGWRAGAQETWWTKKPPPVWRSLPFYLLMSMNSSPCSSSPSFCCSTRPLTPAKCTMLAGLGGHSGAGVSPVDSLGGGRVTPMLAVIPSSDCKKCSSSKSENILKNHRIFSKKVRNSHCSHMMVRKRTFEMVH